MPTYFHHAFPPSPLVSPFLPRKIEFEYLQNAPEKIPKRICIIHRINIGRDKIITPRQSLSNKTTRRILLVSRMLQIPFKSEQKLCRNVETQFPSTRHHTHSSFIVRNSAASNPNISLRSRCHTRYLEIFSKNRRLDEARIRREADVEPVSPGLILEFFTGVRFSDSPFPKGQKSGAISRGLIISFIRFEGVAVKPATRARASPRTLLESLHAPSPGID